MASKRRRGMSMKQAKRIAGDLQQPVWRRKWAQSKINAHNRRASPSTTRLRSDSNGPSLLVEILEEQFRQ